MFLHRFLFALILSLGALVLAAPVAHAQTGGNETISGFVAALNNGDLATASQFMASDFQVTLTDGTVVSGTDALQTLADMGRPVQIISFAAPVGQSTRVVLQFGSNSVRVVDFLRFRQNRIRFITVSPFSGLNSCFNGFSNFCRTPRLGCFSFNCSPTFNVFRSSNTVNCIQLMRMPGGGTITIRTC